jgi:hypothetical protein
MTEEEKYYIENRFKISENDMSTWRYFPIGEVKRKIYDYHYQPLNLFLERYYQDFSNMNQWRLQWMEAIVIPAFENDVKKLSERLGDGVFKTFSHKRMIDFYFRIKDLDFFENDIKLFLSWMNGMNFFESQKISFTDWINSSRYNIGGRHRTEGDQYSLQDIAKEAFGNNLIRDKIMSLEWHKR